MRFRLPKAPGQNGALSVDEVAAEVATRIASAPPGQRLTFRGAHPVVASLARGGRGDLARAVADAMPLESRLDALFLAATHDPDLARARDALEEGQRAASRWAAENPRLAAWATSPRRAAAELRLGDAGAPSTFEVLRADPSRAYRSGLGSLIEAYVDGGDLLEALRVARTTRVLPATPGSTTSPEEFGDPSCGPLTLALARRGRMDDALEAFELLSGSGSMVHVALEAIEDACARGAPVEEVERWASLRFRRGASPRAAAVEALVEHARPRDAGEVFARWREEEPPDAAAEAQHVLARARLGHGRAADATLARAALADAVQHDDWGVLFRLTLEAGLALGAHEQPPPTARSATEQVRDIMALGLLLHRRGDVRGGVERMHEARARATELRSKSSLGEVARGLVFVGALTDAAAVLKRLRVEDRGAREVTELARAYSAAGDLAGAVACTRLLDDDGGDLLVLAKVLDVVLPRGG